MKKLSIIFSIFVVSINAQIKTPKCNSFTENKELSKVIFNTVNSYRVSLNESPYKWSEYWYQSALKWNTYLSSNALWGHRNGYDWDKIDGTELICGVTLSNSTVINDKLYQYIADSCLNQWIHSPMHHAVLKAPLRTTKQTSCRLDLDNDGKLDPFNTCLCNYGAISVNVNEYKDCTIVQVIFHLGWGIDNIHIIPSL
jgi:hypothetical protein